MTKIDIMNIINCWSNLSNDAQKNKVNKFRNEYIFLPLKYINEKGFFIIDPRFHVNMQNSEDFVYGCKFIKKHNLKNILIGDNNNFYTENINLTASRLWNNHTDKNAYYLTWLYALCTHIDRNSANINLCKNEIFIDYIRNILDYFKQINIKEDFEKYYTESDYDYLSNRILPDGLLTRNFYKINDTENIDKQIHKILFTEIIYILSENYLCLFS